MVKKDIKKYLVVTFLLILIYISYLIIKPFITALLTSFVLAYLFYPLYRKTSNITKNKYLAATLITALIIIILIFPLVSVTRSIVTESLALYRSGVIEQTTSTLSQYLTDYHYLSVTLNSIIEKFVNFIKEESTEFLISIPSRIFHFLIVIYTTFGLFLVGEDFLKKAKNLLPTKRKDELVKHIGDTTYSIVYGLFVTAILEFIISLIAFKFIGTDAAILLALIIGFLAFIPFLGPIIIWLPYALLELTRNNFNNVIILILLGVILFFIDTFLKARIISNHSKVHPIIILIGTIGGIQLFGFIGLIIGPVFLSALITIIKEYYPMIKHEA